MLRQIYWKRNDLTLITRYGIISITFGHNYKKKRRQYLNNIRYKILASYNSIYKTTQNI